MPIGEPAAATAPAALRVAGGGSGHVVPPLPRPPAATPVGQSTRTDPCSEVWNAYEVASLDITNYRIVFREVSRQQDMSILLDSLS